MKRVALDFETHYTGEYSVKKLGHALYARDPRFRCTMAAAWSPTIKVSTTPDRFPWDALDGAEIVAHNAAFDRAGVFGAVDWKTRRTKPTEKSIKPYDGQAMQLAAYLAARVGAGNLHKVRAVNVYISTTEPGRISVYEHPGLEAEYHAFLAACALWRHLKGFDPRVR